MTKTDYSKWSKSDLIKEVKKLEKRKKYGIVWDEETNKEVFEEAILKKFPVLQELKNKEIITNQKQSTNFLIEGENYHSLSVLNYTHKNKIDLIFIDPPYNTGKEDFRYNDKWINNEDGYRHSKWLSFMNKRLVLAKKLLKQNGLIVVHIDENEQTNLHALMNHIFMEKNFLGTMIWNKKNPKGDAKGVAYQHESILIYAKNKEIFLETNQLNRKKVNAGAILKKAKIFFSRVNKDDFPHQLNEVIKKYKIPRDSLSNYKKKLSLEDINIEFQDWIKTQNFSGGEKAYSKINETGKVYQTVSMAWPNKKKAPEQYFKPLIHPKTKKKCPVPERGWRYPPKTMEQLQKQDLIKFGINELVQPRQKYFLTENLSENIPSIINFGGSDDILLKNLGVSFENPKPFKFTTNLLDYFLNKNGMVLDYMAGSGTTGHAVLELNKLDNGNRRFILCTNNENEICTNVLLPRLSKIIKGYKNQKNEKVEGLGGNLKYFQTDFVESAPTDRNKKKLVDKSTEMLCLKEDCFDEVKFEKSFKIFKNNEDQYLGIIYDDDGIESFKNQIAKIKKKISTYVFSLDESAREEEFEDILDLVDLKPIPEVILNVYSRIFK